MLNDIYFLNTSGLCGELKAGTFSEVRALKHLIVTAIIGKTTFSFPLQFDIEISEPATNLSLMYLLSFLLIGVIHYYGIWLIYQVNQKGDGENFFFRFVALTLPIGFQLFMTFLLASLLFGFFALQLVEKYQLSGFVFSTFVLLAGSVIFFILFYLRMKTCFYEISQDKVSSIDLG